MELLISEDIVKKLFINKRTIFNNFGPVFDSIIEPHTLSILAEFGYADIRISLLYHLLYALHDLTVD